MSRKLTAKELEQAAQVVIDIMDRLGLPSCLVGSSACFGHGTSRIPNDIDMLVLTEKYTAASLKQLIQQLNPSFSLTPGEGPPRPWHPLLSYKMEQPSPILDGGDEQLPTCRIDILVPGTIKLFALPPSRIVKAQRSGLPILPYIPALLHKILAWLYHKETSKDTKVFGDVRDIRDMLELDLQRIKEKGDAITVEEAKEWLPGWFVEDALEGIKAFILECPDTSSGWEKIGIKHEING